MTGARYFAIIVALISAGAVHKAAAAPGPSNAIVWLETSGGDILLEMQAADVAPVTVANFLWYVDEGFYDGLIFHRVIEGFMIQGGGFDPNLVKKEPNDPIINESFNALLNQRGTLAMARTDDPNSATSEFFINHQDNPSLDPDPSGPTESQRAGYCVFGRVLEGIDIVDSIAATPTKVQGSHLNVPIDTVLIERASRIPVLVDVTADRYDPCSNALEAFLNEDVALSVRIENAGSELFDPNAIDPCSLLIFSLVEAGMAADDPNADVLGQFSPAALAAGAVATEILLITLPSQPGEYILAMAGNDSRMAGGFKLSDGMRRQSIALVVEPNAPDLIVLDPDASEIATWTQAELDFTVAVQNIGGVGAGTFTVQLYLATDPNFSENDPGTQRVTDADFVVDQLDERTSHSETLSVVMPAVPGTYYLRAVADDSNAVLEFDENNNAGAAVTLTVANRIDVTRLKAKAGADPNRDGFDLRGQLTNVELDDLLDAVTIDIEIGTYSQSLNVEGMPGLVGGRKYVYRGAKGFVTLAVFDMRTGKFRIVAKNISLRGTTDPVAVRISFADYRARGEVADALINRGKGIPFRYQLGLADALRVDKYRYTTFASTRNKDSIRVSGRISLKDYPIDLSGMGVKAHYGRSFSIAEGDEGLRQRGASERYWARRSPADGAAITKAVFNLARGTFSISIRRKALLNPPPQALTLTLIEDDEVIFEEVASVGN